MSPRKKIKRPRESVFYFGDSMVWMTMDYINRDLKTAKRLHTWLGLAIKYLEQEKK